MQLLAMSCPAHISITVLLEVFCRAGRLLAHQRVTCKGQHQKHKQIPYVDWNADCVSLFTGVLAAHQRLDRNHVPHYWLL